MLLTQDEAGVRLLTLNRPETLNAFNDTLYRAVAAELVDAFTRPDIRCVVLTGSGRAFSAGEDLSELQDGRSPEERQNAGLRPFMDALMAFGKPLIAAVNGLAVGIGTTLLPYCDFVLAGASARFRTPFVNLGLAAEAGSSVLLPARIGRQAAAHLLYTGEWLDAAGAVETGLAWRKYADDELLPEALALARSIARQPVTALVATKTLLIAGEADAIRNARGREDMVFTSLLLGSEHRAALKAALNRKG